MLVDVMRQPLQEKLPKKLASDPEVNVAADDDSIFSCQLM